MPTPTRKHSRARQGTRRANWKLSVASMTRCPQCAAVIRTHRICPGCGFYRGEQWVAIKPKKSSAENA